MPELELTSLGFVIYLLAISYALGQFWYSIFEMRHENWMRTLSYPLLGIVGGEALWVQGLPALAGPSFLGIHVLVVFICTLIATLLDLAIHVTRRAHEPELRAAIRRP